MKFSEYVNKTWDAKGFCEKLAVEAWYTILEMAMGNKKIADPKLGVLHDADDYKFLSQFPYDVWSKALNWRYNQGLRDMMRTANAEDVTDIPEDWDYTDEVRLPVGDSGKYYRFGKQGGPNNIYIGLTTLAKKLTAPVKRDPSYQEPHPDNPDLPHPHWEDEGLSLRDIDPNQTDETHPAHPKNYKHGLYDFDLADMAEVTDEDIDKIPDVDIQALLGPPLSKQDVKHPEVKAAITRIRKKMKDVKKHTFSAYSVPQVDTTSANISDWVAANALRLYGTHPPEYYDELTGKKHVVGEKTPQEMYEKYKNNFKGTSKGKLTLKHNIPTIDKNMSYEVINKHGKVIDSHNGPVTIPHLNPQKGVPQLHKAEGAMKITPEQRLQIAQFRAKETPSKWRMADQWKLGPGEKLPEAIKRWGDPFEDASKIDTFKNFLKFWPIWSEEQKHWLRQNARSLMHLAKKVHSDDPSLEDDQLSKPQNVYFAGPSPNRLSQGQGLLNVPKNKMTEFRNKYLRRIELELLGDTTEGGGQGYESSGLMDRILKRMSRDPKYPPQVIAALESRSKDLTTFAAYNLLTWLNDPKYGMGPDPEFNLLIDKDGNPIEVDSEENAIRRAWKVEWFLKSAAQIGFNDVLSRRRREKGGMGLMGTLDAPMGDTGQTGAGQVTAGQKPKEVPEFAEKRRWLRSDPGSVARAGQKTHSLLTKGVGKFFAQKRNQILKNFEGAPDVASDLEKAEKSIDHGLQMAIELYQKYDKEYESQFPDEAQREEEIMKKIHDDLSKHESMSHLNIEDVMSKAKTMITAGKTDADDLKIKEAMDDFMQKFLAVPKGKSIYLPSWNEITKQAVPTSTPIVPSNIPPHPHNIAQIIAHVYQNRPGLILDALKQWGGRAYENIVHMHGDVGKSDSELNKEWQEEMANWHEKYADEFKYKHPEQPQQMPQQPAQAPALAAKALGKSLPELFRWATKVGSVEDMMRVGQGLLDRKNELLAQKGSADQVAQAIEAMRERRKFIKTLSSPQEHNMMNGMLQQLEADLRAAHE